jgi:3-deoxy-D-manno-octulosonic-acid transferase
MGLGAALKTDIQGSKGPDDVIILNTLGELARVYGLADVSFVGGSMVPFGGHNMLEPASFGCPVVYGIHTENFVDLAQKLQENRGGWRVENGRELYDVIKKLLDDPVVRQESGRKAKNFVGENRGALGRVMNHISANIN